MVNKVNIAMKYVNLRRKNNAMMMQHFRITSSYVRMIKYKKTTRHRNETQRINAAS
jgi:hypothetical protein